MTLVGKSVGNYLDYSRQVGWQLTDYSRQVGWQLTDISRQVGWRSKLVASGLTDFRQPIFFKATIYIGATLGVNTLRVVFRIIPRGVCYLACCAVPGTFTARKHVRRRQFRLAKGDRLHLVYQFSVGIHQCVTGHA